MSQIQIDVKNWLIAGSDPKVGLRLFLQYANPLPLIAKVVSANPDRHLSVIKSALIKASGVVLSEPRDPEKAINKPIREDYPFLKEDDCPPELKILVGDKITTYHNYCDAYDRLTAASNPKDHLDAVSYLVANFVKNQEIHAEFEYYKAHKKVLGNHPIFKEYQRLRNLRKLPALELARMKENLENNIYRNQRKLDAGSRPDLRIQREENLRKQKIELAEIIRLLQ